MNTPSQGYKQWRISSESGGDQGSCVDVGLGDLDAETEEVAFRDSTLQGRGPVLGFPASAVTALTGAIKVRGSRLAGGF
ncbi:DUF397 domain-containing protein [Kitasatospora viridis]|uniref:Uncharacterized protein DUF397 n=1 Tax=Kitasatospora viridis TaxID=281105 RepID=A0A561SA37_9ACTN|nr:DUF397 domain-containing protein [Kitasatospora viridis]TWF71738.1 uncharacterized protein DUF397 [Kitasatospora viridis]